jgi:hypothetical protein
MNITIASLGTLFVVATLAPGGSTYTKTPEILVAKVGTICKEGWTKIFLK